MVKLYILWGDKQHIYLNCNEWRHLRGILTFAKIVANSDHIETRQRHRFMRFVIFICLSAQPWIWLVPNPDQCPYSQGSSYPNIPPEQSKTICWSGAKTSFGNCESMSWTHYYTRTHQTSIYIFHTQHITFVHIYMKYWVYSMYSIIHLYIYIFNSVGNPMP